MPSYLKDISVLILTLDEEVNLPSCLASLEGAADIFVVDSFSADRTCEIAESHGARVYRYKFENYSKQWNWAIDNMPWRTEWGFAMAADEVITPELAKEMSETINAKPEENGFELRRKFIWMDRWLKHGGLFSEWGKRLFRVGKMRCEDRSVNEHFLIDGEVGKLRSCLLHDNRKGLAPWLDKHNRYSTMEAEEALRGKAEGQVEARFWTRDPAARKRYIRRHVWPYLPFKPTLFFAYQYVFRLGFLDGTAGYRYARLKSQYVYWTELKKKEMRRERDGGRARPSEE